MTVLRFSGPLKSVAIEEGYTPVGFLRIPPETAEAIASHAFERRLEMGRRRGFGSVRVTVTLGGSTLQTSLFPNKDGSWFLPVKKPVRLAEEIAEGDEVTVELVLH